MLKLAAFLACLLLGFPAAADMYQDASNSKTDTAFRFGTGLYPQYARAVTTTAATTTGSSNITVASSAGILVGDSISAQSPTFVALPGANPGAMAVVVTAIVGNVVTLSANAASTNAAASVTFGTDRSTPGKTLLTDVIGAKYGYFGAAAKGHSTWANQYWAGLDYPVLSSVTGISDNANQGGMFATRTSDNPSSTWVIALGSLLVDDSTSGAVRSTWNNYWQSNLIGTVPGTHIQTESSIYSRWAPVALDPYTKDLISGTENLRLDCGYEAGTSLNCSTALHITPNQAKYLTGMIIDSNSVEPSGGPVSSAIAMPRQYAIDWFAPGPTNPRPTAWRMYSTATATSGTSYFDLADNGTVHISGTSPYTQYNAPSARIGQVGMIDGLNMTIDNPGVGATVLKANGQINVVMSGGLTNMSAPVTGFRLQPYSVATLPVCNDGAAYTIASVGDMSVAPTYRGALTGGGIIRGLAMCNGATWEAH